MEQLLDYSIRVGDFIETPVADLTLKILENGQPDLLIGTTIGHYELLERIGAGGMGEVYLARDIVAGRKAALKLLPLRFTGNPERLKRFEQEAHAVVAFNHPNIVTVYEIGQDHEAPYIASELIAGETLRQRLSRGAIPLEEALEIATQVASALAAAHEADIIHRDIKPENIMLRPDGYVKVLDFGIAKLVEQELPSTGGEPDSPLQTCMGSIVGTPNYMSPEQARSEPVTNSTDIWSVGLVLYEMLAGRPPFMGASAKEVTNAILTTQPASLTALPAIVRAELQQIIDRSLRKDRRERYSSCPELIAALKHVRRRLEAEVAPKQGRRPLLAAAATMAAAITLAFYFYRHTPAQSPPQKSIAVLPFENLSPDKDNAYFAGGIQNEILTKLASIADLKVISRTSTAKYQSKPDNLKTVAQELGVSTVLEGAVQKAGDKVRVNVQLIDARADTHLWAKSYDRDLKDVLAVESEVSQQIADALQANLSPSESHALASVGTRDAEAYDLFLKGEYEFHQADSTFAGDAYDRAEAFYRQALARDPNFVEAAAKLAESRLSRHYFVSPLTATELEEMKSIIDHALALAPNSPEAHFALAMFFYYGHRQWDNALTELNRTLELQPNNAAAREGCAAVYRRRGEWERSLRDFQRAQELDPRAAETPAELGTTYAALRMWKEAERAELRALAIDPHKRWAATCLLVNRLNATGDADFARRALDGFPQAIQWRTAFAGRGSRDFGDVTHIIGVPIYLDVIQRRFTDAFEALDKQVTNTDIGRRHQLAGRVILRLLAGERAAAKSAAEEALPPFEATLRERPDMIPSAARPVQPMSAYTAMMELSWVYLALERNTDALRLSRQAAELVPIEKDAFLGSNLQALLAQIEARAGAPEEAIKRLRRLLSIPAGHVISIARLKIDPVWDPIRNRPDFQQLLSGPEQIGPNK